MCVVVQAYFTSNPPARGFSLSLYQKYAIFLRIINARCMQHDQASVISFTTYLSLACMHCNLSYAPFPWS